MSKSWILTLEGSEPKQKELFGACLKREKQRSAALQAYWSGNGGPSDSKGYIFPILPNGGQGTHGGANIVSASAGCGYCAVLTSDDRVYVWGGTSIPEILEDDKKKNKRRFKMNKKSMRQTASMSSKDNSFARDQSFSKDKSLGRDSSPRTENGEDLEEGEEDELGEGLNRMSDIPLPTLSLVEGLWGLEIESLSIGNGGRILASDGDGKVWSAVLPTPKKSKKPKVQIVNAQGPPTPDSSNPILMETAKPKKEEEKPIQLIYRVERVEVLPPVKEVSCENVRKVRRKRHKGVKTSRKASKSIGKTARGKKSKDKKKKLLKTNQKLAEQETRVEEEKNGEEPETPQPTPLAPPQPIKISSVAALGSVNNGKSTMNEVSLALDIQTGIVYSWGYANGPLGYSIKEKKESNAKAVYSRPSPIEMPIWEGEDNTPPETAKDTKSIARTTEYHPKITQIATGATHCAALDSKGRVLAWGGGNGFSIGTGHPGKFNSLPGYVEFSQESDLNTSIIITSVECGDSFTIALSSEGRVYTWGAVSSGVLGYKGKDDRVKPGLMNPHAFLDAPKPQEEEDDLEVTDDYDMRSRSRSMSMSRMSGTLSRSASTLLIPPKIVQIGAGSTHCIVLTDGGKVWSWGQGRSGALGHGGVEDEPVPRLIEGLKKVYVNQVVAGGTHTIVLGVPEEADD
ncbi:hypothetical protein AAMO2058_000652100 [Amorphochlora amoebiformis]